MLSSLFHRRAQLGQSFTTCLLMVVLFFGGIGTYYFKIFQWRHLENPLSDLLIVKGKHVAEVTNFRNRTTPEVIDPALQQLDRLVELRKSTKAATQLPEDYKQTCTEIANSLLSIMEVAKQRQIPEQHAKKYDQVLLGISEIYKSLRAFEEAAASDIPADKERAVTNSIKLSKSAARRFKITRPHFMQ